MRDLNDDGSLSRNAIYQQLELTEAYIYARAAKETSAPFQVAITVQIMATLSLTSS
jgi:hypothetical protein